MTDEEKLFYIKSQFNLYIMKIETLTEFKMFLQNITKDKVIIALKDRVQKDIEEEMANENNAKARIEELTQFKEQLNQF